MTYDLIIRSGTLIDGTGAPRRVTDVGVKDGHISKIGDLKNESAAREIDASDQIVSPGVIDVHCHYDAHINWDPYCTCSSLHGTTTVVMANCGFGYAPCREEHRERNMLLMLNTEQIPIATQREVLNWNWETFPEWMDHLRAIPKGVNTAMYLPMNPLLLYVKGQEVKSRPTTAAERRRMRELMHEAMDSGACGFSFTLLKKGNNHVDFDGTPVPTDIMEPEDAYNLAWVLRERGEGVIQAMVEHNHDHRHEVTEQLARISCQPVIHNVCVPYEVMSENPSQEEIRIANQWKETLAWCDELRSQGLKIYLQTATRAWSEFKINEEFGAFFAIPVFEDFGLCKTPKDRLAMASDPVWRNKAREAYSPDQFMLGGITDFVLCDAHGEPTYAKYEGKTVNEIAVTEGKKMVDTFFDILVATKMEADFRSGDHFWDIYSAEKVEKILRNPAALAGTSDGGAHIKSFTGGHFPTELINWMVRDEKRMTLEEVHQILSQRPADVFGFEDRGVLTEGKAADIVIYDFDTRGYVRKYETLYDVPGGEYRRSIPAQGVSHVFVNGEEIVDESGKTTGAHPGQVACCNRDGQPQLAAAI